MTLSHICYRSMLLDVLLLAWGLIQASVAFSSWTKSSRVREFHGETLGENEKLERGPKARPLGK